MKRPLPVILAASSLALLSGCTSDSQYRFDGVSGFAGDAIAANMAMQMVDPWMYGVQDTKLKVPAERRASQSGGESDSYDSSGSDSGAATP